MPPRPRAQLSDGAAPSSVAPIPPVRVHAAASLPPTPLDVTVAGRQYVIPALHADRWLEVLWNEPLLFADIFPGLAEGQAEHTIDDALIEGDVTVAELVTVAQNVLTEASGYQWWFAVNLAKVVEAAWDRIGGEMLTRGLRADQMSFGAWLSAAYTTLLRLIEPEKAAAFVSQLTTPPPGFESHIDHEAESAAFLAAMRGM